MGARERRDHPAGQVARPVRSVRSGRSPDTPSARPTPCYCPSHSIQQRRPNPRRTRLTLRAQRSPMASFTGSLKNPAYQFGLVTIMLYFASWGI
ncbi:hypothetical protein GCM10027268_09650 [Brachybacterium huguangmaarense]